MAVFVGIFFEYRVRVGSKAFVHVFFTRMRCHACAFRAVQPVPVKPGPRVTPSK